MRIRTAAVPFVLAGLALLTGCATRVGPAALPSPPSSSPATSAAVVVPAVSTAREPVLPCPTPAQARTGTLALARVECFDGNQWLLEYGRYPDGSIADGVMVVRQLAPGRYVTVTAGSSFPAESAPTLTRKGLPADLVRHLVTGQALEHQTQVDGPQSA